MSSSPCPSFKGRLVQEAGRSRPASPAGKQAPGNGFLHATRQALNKPSHLPPKVKPMNSSLSSNLCCSSTGPAEQFKKVATCLRSDLFGDPWGGQNGQQVWRLLHMLKDSVEQLEDFVVCPDLLLGSLCSLQGGMQVGSEEVVLPVWHMLAALWHKGKGRRQTVSHNAASCIKCSTGLAALWQACCPQHCAGNPGVGRDARPALLSLDAGWHRHLVLQHLVEVPSQGGEGGRVPTGPL